MADSVIKFPVRAKTTDHAVLKAQVDTGGGGGDDGHMEARIAALEAANIETRERLARIETRLDSVATKSDLSAALANIEKSFAGVEKSLHALTWRILGGCGLLVAATYFIAKHIG
ncbi:hypothetical protein [Burkholderia multivorans]|uniref:hypothetical protein n=1 Tax=Burkholderia multivorans TaxID=87883 RepID=UPI0015925362|nr:hypothetical protein [Burkholderia multivorans]MBU9496241.1 hypothetical protein [Burkholderia multivorans]MDN7511972.1 hypothetical protein [Burkholderia multivorans]MDN8056343.1 hypothetical protein [Burkholderia multivorans]